MININKTLPEVIQTVSEKAGSDSAQKVELLKAYDTKQMRWLVDNMYNRDMSPFFVPTYKRSVWPPEICPSNIGRSINRMEVAFRVLNAGQTEHYRRLMTLVFESVSAAEADLLENFINGKKIEGISKSVWKKVYPEFFRSPETDGSE